MLVITETRIAKCSELCLSGSKIVGFIDNCKDCSFTADCYNSSKEAKERFDIVAEAVKSHGENIVIDFRRIKAGE